MPTQALSLCLILGLLKGCDEPRRQADTNHENQSTDEHWASGEDIGEAVTPSLEQEKLPEGGGGWATQHKVISFSGYTLVIFGSNSFKRGPYRMTQGDL